MKSMLARFVCRILAASMIVVPFHAHAGLIGTDQAVYAPLATNAVSRGELAAQLQMLGLSPEAAAERVAALSDTEIASLAGQVEALPAGGVGGLLPIMVLIFLIWRFTASDQAKAEAAARDKAAKPAAKPAPEKK